MAWPNRKYTSPGCQSLPILSFLGRRVGFFSFPLEMQSCVLTIPGSSRDLWAQGPLAVLPTHWTQGKNEVALEK